VSDAAAAPIHPDRYRWVALSVTTVGALLASVQGSALIIALPDVMTGLRASFLAVMWVLMGYLLTTTSLVPIVGRLADMFGRKKLYNAGFALFSLASLLAGFAQARFDGWDLVAYRVLQGVGAALLFTNSTAIVTDAFRGYGRVGLGLGVNQVAAAAGFLLGPLVGGALTAISWRWVFWVNVPIGVFGTLWGMWRLREPVKLPVDHRFDLLGSLLFAGGLGSLLAALSLVAFPMTGTGVVVALFAAAAVLLPLFVWNELRAEAPIIDLRLFRDRLFGIASAATVLNSLARGAVLFILIFYLQGPYAKDPLTAGVMMTPFGAAFLLVGPLSGHWSDRLGSRVLSTVGLLVSAVGLYGMSTLTATSPYWQLALWMALMGGGSGLFNSPNMNAIMSSVRPERRGMAAGTATMLQNVGTMMSIAIAFPLVLSRIPPDVMMRIFLVGGGMGNEPAALSAFLGGMREAFLAAVAVTLVAALVSALRPTHSNLAPASATPPSVGGGRA
jgi:EmrB/QacA subfamily drug resistance transporter